MTEHAQLVVNGHFTVDFYMVSRPIFNRVKTLRLVGKNIPVCPPIVRKCIYLFMFPIWKGKKRILSCGCGDRRQDYRDGHDFNPLSGG